MARMSNVVDFESARGSRAPVRAHGGYIRLYRSTMESAFSNKPNHLSAWVHMLGMATHKRIKTMLGGRSIELQRGQFVSGRKALAERIGITEKQLRNILDFMVDEGMITLDARRAGTIFTVLNFDFYQGDGGQPSTTPEATDHGASDEKRANEGPARGQPRANDLGQRKGQPDARNHGACSETGANERANPNPAKRATKYKNTNISTSQTAREGADLSDDDQILSDTGDHPDQPAYPSGYEAAQVFAMHLDWQPSDVFTRRCLGMGVDLQTLPPDLANQWLGEYRSHWEANGEQNTQAQWEHKLAQRFEHQVQRIANSTQAPTGQRRDSSSPIASRSERQANRARITESTMDIQDTTW